MLPGYFFIYIKEVLVSIHLYGGVGKIFERKHTSMYYTMISLR